jgi:hypothetical protein
MIATDSNSRDIFKDLRQNLYYGEPMTSSDVAALRAELDEATEQQKFTLWRRLRGLGVMPDATEAAVVLGVIMEIGADDGATTLVFGLGDGSASVYHSTGGGHIGGQTRPHINAAARELTSVASDFVSRWPVTEIHPLPGPGRVRFSLLTPAGVHTTEEQQDKLVDGAHVLSPLFQAANEIIVGFETAPALQANDESGYVTCLLTTLAKSGGKGGGETGGPAVVLVANQAVPDLATLTEDPREVERISRLAFPYDRLSTKKVMSILLRTAGFPRLQLGNGEHTLRTKLKTTGETPEEVAFLVSRRKEQGQTQVEVRMIRI